MSENKQERIAKAMARSGLCSRRAAEKMIEEGRVQVNDQTVATPAFFLDGSETVKLDGKVIKLQFEPARPRLFLYHKPSGLLTTNHDPQGRPCIFDKFPAELPRVVTVGRLDMNTEGLLLLSTDGQLARFLELPVNKMKRTYRVRAFGQLKEDDIEKLAKGIRHNKIKYAPAIVTLEKEQGRNNWLQITIEEGKNREVRNLMEAVGLKVNRLIRVSYGPFGLNKLPKGAIQEIPYALLKKQLPEYFSRKSA
jgi:23S rRNA pseudouridine2605 synthase